LSALLLSFAALIFASPLFPRLARASHVRPCLASRYDYACLRTTVASYNPETGRPDIAHEEVEVGLVVPRLRNYATSHAPAKEEKSEKAVAGS